MDLSGAGVLAQLGGLVVVDGGGGEYGCALAGRKRQAGSKDSDRGRMRRGAECRARKVASDAVAASLANGRLAAGMDVEMLRSLRSSGLACATAGLSGQPTPMIRKKSSDHVTPSD